MFNQIIRVRAYLCAEQEEINNRHLGIMLQSNNVMSVEVSKSMKTSR